MDQNLWDIRNHDPPVKINEQVHELTYDDYMRNPHVKMPGRNKLRTGKGLVPPKSVKMVRDLRIFRASSIDPVQTTDPLKATPAHATT